MADNTCLTFKGQPIADMTKQELIEALTWAFDEIEYQRQQVSRYASLAIRGKD